MPRGRTNPVLVTRVRRGEERRRRPDKVVVEEPMEIRLDDHLVATTMRTPGHDYELAVGFLFTEGLLHGHPVSEVRYCATGSAVDTGFNIVSVSTNGRAPAPAPRLGTTTSSCGLCGSTTIDELADRLAPRPGPPAGLDLDVVLGVAAEVRAAQELFAATGSVHAAAAFDAATGAVRLVREDVGRHNAVDKVVGHLVLGGVVSASEQPPVAEGIRDEVAPDPMVSGSPPLKGNLVANSSGEERQAPTPEGPHGAERDRQATASLFVSGRVSFEIVQKAWAAGFGMVVGVSGPTALAVETAQRAGLTLAGFLRDDSINLYT